MFDKEILFHILNIFTACFVYTNKED